ncbi:uncharacterized protein BO96DRAFT_439143 [Aspergillus niger CBS 101883]|uniref:uncharacterized protein n=1 Tax=Aspergillus lacticoffeatus (strain CBS 101883) TaxID=1450533 RepID=UPI000D7F67D9|nr:uncharacterized protein BO96DRAFT_439143 [Aspergillus niger CBS 101883]PYH51192.1 hypothetical protein BO96DRAFT_439143 [Aspergillus niger CBS 101883]
MFRLLIWWVIPVLSRTLDFDYRCTSLISQMRLFSPLSPSFAVNGTFTPLDVLYDYNSRYYHASALIFVAIRGDLYLAGRLLDGLKAAVGKSCRLPHPAHRKWALLGNERNSDVNSGPDSELIDSAESLDSDDEDMAQMFSFADNARHPLRAARYSSRTERYGGIASGPWCTAELLSGSSGCQIPIWLGYVAGLSSPRRSTTISGRSGGATNVESSLKLAAQRGDQSMMEFMLGHGARADLCGAAAHHVALRIGDDDMACLLKSKGAPAYYLWESKDDWDEEEGDGTKPELKLYGCGLGMSRF